MKPKVIVYSEVSADGKTSHARGASSKPMMIFEDDIVGRFRHEQRAQADAIMVGSNTVRTDNPRLTVRDVDGPSPLRVIPASLGLLPLDSNIFTDGGRTLIAVSQRATATTISALEAAGASVVRVGESGVDLSALLDHLSRQGVRNLMVEGGASLLASLFQERLVDRLIIQHLPVIFGGRDAPAMVGGIGIERVDQAPMLKLKDVRQLGRHAIITYDCCAGIGEE